MVGGGGPKTLSLPAQERISQPTTRDPTNRRGVFMSEPCGNQWDAKGVAPMQQADATSPHSQLQLLRGVAGYCLGEVLPGRYNTPAETHELIRTQSLARLRFVFAGIKGVTRNPSTRNMTEESCSFHRAVIRKRIALIGNEETGSLTNTLFRGTRCRANTRET